MSHNLNIIPGGFKPAFGSVHPTAQSRLAIYNLRAASDTFEDVKRWTAGGVAVYSDDGGKTCLFAPLETAKVPRCGWPRLFDTIPPGEVDCRIDFIFHGKQFTLDQVLAFASERWAA